MIDPTWISVNIFKKTAWIRKIYIQFDFIMSIFEEHSKTKIKIRITIYYFLISSYHFTKNNKQSISIGK